MEILKNIFENCHPGFILDLPILPIEIWGSTSKIDKAPTVKEWLESVSNAEDIPLTQSTERKWRFYGYPTPFYKNEALP